MSINIDSFFNLQSKPLMVLAPMEGITDWSMRNILTGIRGIDLCVTEFLRVTDHLHSDEIFYKYCPELKTSGLTEFGTPVFLQLLGSNVEFLSLNAVRAVELGAKGVDLNFGCPAKTVNRHDGGASLLQYTDRIYKIVKSVRDAVPSHVPVTAKIRLGYESPEACLENAKAIEEAGATWLTVHCRTKTDGYKPPAHWEWIEKIKNVSKIHLITNGEIWNYTDYSSCFNQTNTMGYMIGRGVLREPFVFQKIQLKNKQQSSEQQINPLIQKFYKISSEQVSPKFAVARTKGWLKQLAQVYPSYNESFETLKTIVNPADFERHLTMNLPTASSYDKKNYDSKSSH